jgi:hypothetical protein
VTMKCRLSEQYKEKRNDKLRRFLKTVRGMITYKLVQSRHRARTGGYMPCTATLNELVKKWTGKCVVCNSGPGSKGICLDHDHSTGEFRGWLCSNCNAALGLMADSPERLRAMAEYVEQ